MHPFVIFHHGQRIIFLFLILFSHALFANPVIPISSQPSFATLTPATPNLEAGGYILMDANSGRVLVQKNPDVHMQPASLTKLMSLYIISSALKQGQVHMEDKVRISEKAWRTEGSRMFVKVGDEVPLKDLLEGVIVASGNDATVALAEHVAGSEEGFVALMNQQAKLLGMKNSHFTDSTGLPNKEHFSSPRDLALLTQSYIKNFPEEYSIYAEKWMSYKGIKQPNRNRLLWRYQYADGLKTGHTSEAGYCLVGSAKKEGMRLISVIMGSKNDQARTEDSIRLLIYGFRFFETHKVYAAAAGLAKVRVWQGLQNTIPLGLTEDFYVTIPTGQYKKLQAMMTINHPLKAPIMKGGAYGILNIVLNNQIVASKPLIAMDGIQRGGFWRRAMDIFKYTFHGYFSDDKDILNRG